MRTPTLEEQIFNILDPEKEMHTPRTLEDLKEEFEKRKICHYCKREMEIGAMGGGELLYGCYHKDCDLKKKHPYDYYSVNLGPLSSRIYDLERAIEKSKEISKLVEKLYGKTNSKKR